MKLDDYGFNKTEKRIVRGVSAFFIIYLLGFFAFWAGVIFLVWKLAFS